MRIFPDPLYYQEGQHNGRPAETINTKVSGKVNLIFYKLNLFPIFLVDKVKKKKRKIVICRIMKSFYYHSGRCHAMRIQHQYANLSRILQFWIALCHKFYFITWQNGSQSLTKTYFRSSLGATFWGFYDVSEALIRAFCFLSWVSEKKTTSFCWLEKDNA